MRLPATLPMVFVDYYPYPVAFAGVPNLFKPRGVIVSRSRVHQGCRTKAVSFVDLSDLKQSAPEKQEAV